VKFYTKNKRPPVITVVSMIDILAILLIFFIVTTTFKKVQPQVVINLPQSTEATDAPAEVEPLILSIDADGVIYLEGVPLSTADLGERLGEIRSATPERPFAMQADEAVGFGLVIEVIDILKANGIENIPAFTERPQ